MNNLQRRLFRRYVEGGGDLANARAVETMVRAVQDSVLLLPARIRDAVELALAAAEDASYGALAAELSERSGAEVTVSAFRQRVARGVRELERAVLAHARCPDRSDPAEPGSTD